ncbi:hypothetical protein B9G99_06360 [Kushneria konosiri]|uniref:Uncharacterized protein n=1 Tax=Kushneria konosiri TaxID=698828 RepID=A0A2Z2H6N8_9GAMM|nr:hypothetical protein B9G99_06360 [Kushneria konosiri]
MFYSRLFETYWLQVNLAKTGTDDSTGDALKAGWYKKWYSDEGAFLPGRAPVHIGYDMKHGVKADGI